MGINRGYDTIPGWSFELIENDSNYNDLLENQWVAEGRGAATSSSGTHTLTVTLHDTLGRYYTYCKYIVENVNAFNQMGTKTVWWFNSDTCNVYEDFVDDNSGLIQDTWYRSDSTLFTYDQYGYLIEEIVYKWDLSSQTWGLDYKETHSYSGPRDITSIYKNGFVKNNNSVLSNFAIMRNHGGMQVNMSITKPTKITASILSVAGKTICTSNGSKVYPEGTHLIPINNAPKAAGFYLVKCIAGNTTLVKPFTVMK